MLTSFETAQLTRADPGRAVYLLGRPPAPRHLPRPHHPARGQGEAVVIVSVLAENVGISPCNAFEKLALQLVDYFQLDPRRLIYLERWGSFSYNNQKRGEEFSVVTFSYDPKGRNAFVPGLSRFAHSTWRRVPRAEVEEIAGGDLPPFPHGWSV